MKTTITINLSHQTVANPTPKNIFGLGLWKSRCCIGANASVSLKYDTLLISAILSAMVLVHGQTYLMMDLGTLGGDASGAEAINNLGQVVGGARLSDGRDNPFLWDATHGMQDLGTLGGSDGIAFAINNTGQVAGYASTSPVVTVVGETNGQPIVVVVEGPMHPFIWDAVHGMRDLGTLGFSDPRALAINDKGQVIGNFYTLSGNFHGFFGDSNHGLRDLGTLGGGYSQANAINNDGQVVGYSTIASDDAAGVGYHAFLWDAVKGMHNLGTLGGIASYPRGINDNGQVVGTSTTSSEGNPWHAFVWNSADGMRDLGTLGGSDSRAWAINGFGQVVGSSSRVNGSSDEHAFLWDALHGMQDLGTLGGPDSFAYGININGQVVGESYTAADFHDIHTFVWDSSKGMQDLGTLGGNRSDPRGINDHGQVVGVSNTADLAYHAFLATPVIVLQSPVQQTSDLDALVQSLSIDAGLKKSLSAKLQAALTSINANNQPPACGALQAFINEVIAQTGKKLTAAQASQLIIAATRIRDTLGCKS